MYKSIGWKDICIESLMDGWIVLVDVWINGKMEGWKEKYKDRWTDGSIKRVL